MQGKVEKDAVIIYESTVRGLEAFPEKDRGRLARIIASYGTGGKIGELSEIERIALQPIFDGIDTEKRRYANVKYLSNLIDGIKKKAINIPKTNENGKANSQYQTVNNLIKVLQRMIVDCRKHDKLPEHVKTDVMNLIKGDPTIRRCLGFQEVTREELLLYDKQWSAKYVGVQNYYEVEG